jgi:hypothetical protein
MAALLDREEYIEQAYFFRVFRERLEEKVPAQEVLSQVHQEILSITRLPMAVQFLATELKHTGQLSTGFARLNHYFTPFQTYVVGQSEDERKRFSIEICLLILERQASYLAGTPTPAGLFVYQFEVLSRNRLGYDEGLAAMETDPMYDEAWRDYMQMVRRQVGIVDFADLLFVRSELYVTEQRRQNASYAPPVVPLFGEKEGKIARANRGRDPLYLFAALQRQLGYPEVPRAKAKDDPTNQILTLKAQLRELQIRVKLLESEMKGTLDLSQFMKDPDLLKGKGGEEI